jgi:hypothetical protein
VITALDDAHVDERIKSRLLDRGRCTGLRIDAPSFRGSDERVWRRSPRRR